VGAWIIAIRPKTLPAAIAPVVVGVAAAHRQGAVALLPAAHCLMGALLLQVASNLANDVFDYEQGKDTEARLGPIRAVQSGLLTPKQARLGLGLVLAGCVLVGTYLVAVSGWPLLAVGILSMLAALAYTAGPYPLGYHGLGDAFVFLFFGPVAVVGTQFAVVGTVTASAFWAAVPMGALTTNILVVNNLRDRAEDAQTGKRTLAVRFGERFALGQALALLSLAYLTTVYFGVRTGSPWPLVLPLISLPLAIRWFLQLRSTRGRAMNALLARAAQILILFGSLFALGLWISA
jgi:1,4-dihydroxy-2-naphthoate octaprenyltransferase